jgi:hypothetical protein
MLGDQDDRLYSAPIDQADVPGIIDYLFRASAHFFCGCIESRPTRVVPLQMTAKQANAPNAPRY